MKLPAFIRIIAEDYDSKDRKLISKLAYSLNTFADNLINITNKNISITDNTNLNIKTITVKVGPTGVPRNTVKFTSDLPSICNGMIVIYSQNQTNSTLYPDSTPFISFTDNSGLITINNVTGLHSDNTYLLKVLLFP